MLDIARFHCNCLFSCTHTALLNFPILKQNIKKREKSPAHNFRKCSHLFFSISTFSVDIVAVATSFLSSFFFLYRVDVFQYIII